MASILVVDDEMDVRELLRRALTQQGYQVTTVPNVEQGLEALAKHPFDLVILDAYFPGRQSGSELITRVRSVKNLVPVIVYTGTLGNDDEKAYRTAGATEVIAKGTSLSEFNDRVARILSPPKPPSAAAEGAARPVSRAVLIVDDDASVRRVLRRFLESKHFGVTEAESGDAALETVRAGTRFAAVFLDVNMPGRDGLSTLRELRVLRPDLGVIMVTGEQDEHTVSRAVELGAAGYVVKPFDFLYLEMLLLSRLEGGASRTDRASG